MNEHGLCWRRSVRRNKGLEGMRMSNVRAVSYAVEVVWSGAWIKYLSVRGLDNQVILKLDLERLPRRLVADVLLRSLGVEGATVNWNEEMSE
jgi:hypothetical protein